MSADLSKKGWVIGLFSFGFLGLVIVARAAKASAEPRQRIMTYSIKGQNFKNCGCSEIN